MKDRTRSFAIAVTLFAILAIPVRLAAQDKQHHHRMPHHYQLVDLSSTFGGPQSYFNPFPLDWAESSSLLNSGGTVTGYADTSLSDPFPNFCLWDCDVVHAFRSQSDGVSTDLGALPGGGSSVALGISANGLIAGLSENGGTDPLYAGLPEVHAVLWEQGKINDLGTLPEGGYQSYANAVNSSGQVVGAAMNTTSDMNPMSVSWLWFWITPPYQYQVRAFLWDKQEGMQDLGTLPGGTDAQAFFINERGQVVGDSYISSTPGACAGDDGYPLTTNSFLWERGKGMKSLGSLGGTCSAATDLNNQGQVIGESSVTGDLYFHAYLWDGSIHDLGGSFGGNGDAAAFAINDRGEAVGAGDTPTGNQAVLWRHVGNIAYLGNLGGDCFTFAAAINATEQIGGGSVPCNEGNDSLRAFLWEDGSMFDLNALIPPDSALHLQFVQNINDRGEIAGTGVDVSGNTHAFLLIPCDEQHHGVEGCDYSPVDATKLAQVRAPQVAQTQSGSLRNGDPIGLRGRLPSAIARRYHMPGGANGSEK
jgi:probable HAF family extracellular repeat protein